ncbi:hypothetical protein CDD81_3592 [Ophiocordyceps australis]|uniref:Chromo domain-containing protein n=1 Tax=Ophiocordyceps australis TaxID=1399860 RepID=A0A2C5Y642_9HYPO|nr:hypothetical protein CDD81_3592 [Ophiocordyceps australis]
MEATEHVTGATATTPGSTTVLASAAVESGASECPDARWLASHTLRRHQLRRSPRQPLTRLLHPTDASRASSAAPSLPAATPQRARQSTNRSMTKSRLLQRNRKSTPRKISTPPDKAEEWFTIRGILQEKKTRGRIQYLVDWDDNPETGKTYSPTWVTSSEVTLEAIREWRLIKKERQKTSSKLPQAFPAADIDDSQPPLAANRRALKRANALLATRSRSATAEDHSRPAKVPKLNHSWTPSEEPAPSITSTASLDTSLDPIEIGNEVVASQIELNNNIVVQIKNLSNIDPSEYLSVENSQETLISSQSLAELEDGDDRLILTSHISFRTIPDSQEPTGSTWNSCQASGSADSPRKEPLVSFPVSDIPSHQPEFSGIFHCEAAESQNQPSLSPGFASQVLAPPESLVPRSQPRSSPRSQIGTSCSQSVVKDTQPEDNVILPESIWPVTTAIGSQDAQIIKRHSLPSQFFSRSHTTGQASPSAASSHSDIQDRDKAASFEDCSPNLVVAQDMTDTHSAERPEGCSTASGGLDRMPDNDLAIAIPRLTAVSQDQPDNKENDHIALSPMRSSESPRAMHAIVDQAWESTVPAAAAASAAAAAVSHVASLDVEPPTVSPADVSKPTDAELNKTFQSSKQETGPNPADSPRESVNLAQVPHESSSSVSSSEDEGSGLSECIITLPFQSSHRPLYDDTLLSAQQEASEFGQVFSAEAYIEPDELLVRKIDQLFGRLYNICDYPQDTVGTVIEDLPPAQLAKYCCDGNPKFNFIFELLQGLRKETKVLVVARSVELLRLLHHMVEALQVDCTCAAIGKLAGSSHTTSVAHVTLVLPTEDVNPLDFDLVVAFDHSFASSSVAKSLSSVDYTSKRLLFLVLVTTHSIEHIDLCLPEGLGRAERKNALLSGVVKARRLVAEPDRGCPEPHEVAANLIDFLNGETSILSWDPVPVPDDVLDIFVPSQTRSQSLARDASQESPALKRKHDGLDDKEEESKRLCTLVNKTSAVDSNEPPLSDDIQEMLDSAGYSTTPANSSKMQVKVPINVLQSLAETIAENRRAMAANELEAEYKAVITNLEARVKDYERSTNEIYKAYRAALEDRTKFEEAKNEAEAALKLAADEVQKENDKTDEEMAKLHAKIERLLGSATGASEGSPLARHERLLEEAQEKIRVLEKRLSNANSDAEYVRSSYREASSAASALEGENTKLKNQIKASNNLERIHQIQAQNEAQLFEGHITTLKAQVKDREMELDRLRDELRQLKNGRRETRQVSVPRSPRMSVMSPRTSRAMVGPASRGNSPAPLTALDGAAMPSGMQYTSTQQPGNGRWNPLRE